MNRKRFSYHVRPQFGCAVENWKLDIIAAELQGACIGHCIIVSDYRAMPASLALVEAALDVRIEFHDAIKVAADALSAAAELYPDASILQLRAAGMLDFSAVY